MDQIQNHLHIVARRYCYKPVKLTALVAASPTLVAAHGKALSCTVFAKAYLIFFLQFFVYFAKTCVLKNLIFFH